MTEPGAETYNAVTWALEVRAVFRIGERELTLVDACRLGTV